MLPASRLLLPLTALLAAGGIGCASTTAAVPKQSRSYGHPMALVKSTTAVGLSRARLDQYLQGKSSNVQMPRPGVWHISIDGVIVLTILERERIRILAPIFALEQLEGELGVQHAVLRRLLQANFDDSADARYAIFEGIVFAAVTQRRSAIEERDLDRFYAQVVNLHKNTFRTGRTGYSSEPPAPDSIEIDPRRDDSLEVPDALERLLPAPRPLQTRSYSSL